MGGSGRKRSKLPDFASCVASGGHVRTVTGPDAGQGLAEGESVDYCTDGSGSLYRGEVKKRQPQSQGRSQSQTQRQPQNPGGGVRKRATMSRVSVNLRIQATGDLRSEERRVGKECRSRWSP